MILCEPQEGGVGAEPVGAGAALVGFPHSHCPETSWSEFAADALWLPTVKNRPHVNFLQLRN
jgi:hypothetical protein